jgi:hypothetical protein
MSFHYGILHMSLVKPGKKFRLKDHDPACAVDPKVSKKVRKAFAPPAKTELSRRRVVDSKRNVDRRASRRQHDVAMMWTSANHMR